GGGSSARQCPASLRKYRREAAYVGRKGRGEAGDPVLQVGGKGQEGAVAAASQICEELRHRGAEGQAQYRSHVDAEEPCGNARSAAGSGGRDAGGRAVEKAA